jgi:hypothetical protein
MNNDLPALPYHVYVSADACIIAYSWSMIFSGTRWPGTLQMRGNCAFLRISATSEFLRTSSPSFSPDARWQHTKQMLVWCSVMLMAMHPWRFQNQTLNRSQDSACMHEGRNARASEALADLVPEAAHDAPADAVDPEVADVLHQLPAHPHRQEDPDHLLPRDEAVVHAAAAAPLVAAFDGGQRVVVGAAARRGGGGLDAAEELAHLTRPELHCGRVGHAGARLHQRVVDAVALADHLERRRRLLRAEHAAAGGLGDGGGVAGVAGGTLRPAGVVGGGGGRRRRELVAGGLAVLVGRRPVEGLVDEVHPLARRLVVLHDQHVARVQRHDLLKPLRTTKCISICC